MQLAATTLTHPAVRLEPFAERHRGGLIAAADANVSIFRHMPFPIAEKGYGAWFDWMREEQEARRWMPFAVVAAFPPPFTGEVAERSEAGGGAVAPPKSQSDFGQSKNAGRGAVGGGGGKIVGQSCYLNLRSKDGGVEIGGTWYAREAQGTAINPASKLLLLDHAFACGAERVEFKTDALNTQSRAALTKLGAHFEGIFRRQMRRPDGSMRDNAYFSVIREEWPALRARIEARLAGFD